MDTALVVGATGLVGSQCLKTLLDRGPYERVIAFTRRPLGQQHPRLVETVVDFDKLEELEPFPAADGWNINVITRLTSGTPYSVYTKTDIANTGSNRSQVNLAGDPNPVNRTPAEWIVPSSFRLPAAATFGTLGRNVFRSDWSRNLDISISEAFVLEKRTTLEFRAEAFNLTNTPVFSAPNSRLDQPTLLGVVSSMANAPRQLQFAARIRF